MAGQRKRNSNIRGSSKIVYVTLNNICKPTAMTNRLLTIVNALNNSGYDVEIACLALRDPLEQVPSDLNSSIGVSFFATQGRVRLFSYLLVLLRFFRCCNKSEFSIWYIYGFHSFLELYFSVFLFFKRGFVIREIAEYPGFYHDVNRIQRVFLSLAFNRSDLVVVINKALRDYVVKHTSTMVVIVNMTVDIRRFALEGRSHKNIITYCGNMYGGKDGVENLIKAFSIFRKKINDQYTLRLIGDISDDGLFGSLRDICDSESIGEYVEFTGVIDRDHVPFLLSESKLLVLARPDNYQSKGGFPTKLGEYLATGIPVIVTDVGEISSFIIDGVNGFLAENNQPEVFANKMLEVIANYDHALGVGNNGRLLAESAFSADSQIDKILPFLGAQRKT